VYLKQLNIHGFKSFASRTCLEFPAKLIGIVGPNGSGKSNICDSIRWVLGEQSSKALRGEKMDDVIFGGTSSSKPAEFAEVKLVFDNKAKYFKSEENELSLVRKIWRSGDSDYIINGESCRLKDIREIIMDTGLGRDAYSIIGQGMVDNIISSRGNERRNIIEEAAGIVKYKAKKADALRKLADTQGNIDRLSDLITELDKQVLPLSVQAQVAQRYLSLKEQLETKHKKKYIFDFDRMHREIDSNRSTILEHKRKHDEHMNKINIFTADAEAMKAKLITLGERLTQIKQDSSGFFTEQETMLSIERELVAKDSELTSNRENYVKNIDDAEDRIADHEDANKILQRDINEHETQKSETELKIKKVEEDIYNITVKLSSSEKQVDSSQDSTIELLNKLGGAKNNQNQYETEHKHATGEAARIKFDIEKLKEKKKDFESKFRKGGEQAQSRDRSTKLEKRLGEIAEKMAKYINEERDLNKTIQNDSQELMSLRTQYNFNDNARKNYERFNYGVKFLMQERQKSPASLPGIHGVVAELLTTPPEFETAVEVALGGQLQSIVVDHNKDTENCIAMLKKNNAGRVTFLPLNTIRSMPPVVPPATLKGFQGIASSLVKFDPKFKIIFEYLLGGVMIVDTLQHANEFIINNRFSGRIVTLGGELINSSGAITGGSLNKSPMDSHLGATEKQEQMRSKMVYLDDKIKQTQQKLEILRGHIESLAREKEASNIELARLSAQLENLQGSHDDFEAFMANYDEEMKAMIEQNKAKEKEAGELVKKIDVAKKLVAELEEKKKAFDEASRKTKDGFSAERMQREELMAQHTSLKVSAAEFTTKLNNFRKSMLENEKEIKKLRERLATSRTELDKLDVAYRENKAKLDDAQKKLEEIKSRTSSFQTEVDGITQEQESLQSQIRIKENLVNSRSKQAREALEKIHQIEVELSSQETQLNNILTRLEMDYKIRVEEFAPYREENMNYEQNDAEIAELARSIEMLGMVNLSAIEDHKSLMGRINELKTQKDDLLSARDDIFKIIEEIDAKSTKLFMQTFTQINQHVSEIFQILFDGGSAKLVLENPEKPLECNIDIKAQPPGKRLQSIMLMSGGEKAMTALSLLFSILRVKPSPFCILDEVEAALDEVNVLRFVKMLNKFTEKTQFLVITHNKQTMQHLDILYGVTMEEKGISKIISVKLEEAFDIVDRDEKKVPALTAAAG